MKYLALLAIISIASCAPRAYPPGPNPLDFPGETQQSVAAMHEENIQEIKRPR